MFWCCPEYLSYPHRIPTCAEGNGENSKFAVGRDNGGTGNKNIRRYLGRLLL